jgi:hypothetical protein
MSNKYTLCGLALATGALLLPLAGSASAAPPLARSIAVPAPLAEQARSDCRWVDNKWTYQRGDKRLVCRPDRPSGRGWNWRNEGERTGWYNPARKMWHNWR